MSVTTNEDTISQLKRQVKAGDGKSLFPLLIAMRRAGASLREIGCWLPGYEPDDENGKSQKHELEGTPLDRGYIGWGPGDDYMSSRESEGWRSNIHHDTWAEFSTAFADSTGRDADLNLIADFYFQVTHDSKNCMDCGQSGYNPETRKLHETWYDHANDGQNRWADKLTQHEVDALVTEGRLYDLTAGGKRKVTAAEVNAWERGRGLGHDAINASICVQARAEKLGVYGLCGKCQGHGYVRTGPDRLVLCMWLLHPRKGASRGVTVKSVGLDDLEAVREFLMLSWKNHEKHFKWVTG